MRKYLISISFLLLLCSVQNCVLKDESQYYPHFIEDYYAMNSISLNSVKVTIETHDYYRLTVQVGSHEWIKNESRKEQLSTKHKDFGGEHWAVNPHKPTVCLDNDITKIRIVILDDWNEQYKKGDDIGAECHIVAGSLYPYILNDYKEPEIVKEPSEFVSFASTELFHPKASVVDNNLTVLISDDTILLSGNSSLKLFDIFIPDNKTTDCCNIQVEVVDDTEKKYTEKILIE